MKQTTFETSGTCSKIINFELDENKCIHNVQFIGGCPGNTIGVAQLVEAMKAEDVVKRLKVSDADTRRLHTRTSWLRPLKRNWVCIRS